VLEPATTNPAFSRQHRGTSNQPAALQSPAMKRLILLALLSLPAIPDAQSPAGSEPPKYALPPAPMVATFDAPPLPQVIVSPTRQQLAIVARRASPTLAELARPMLRLGGLRVDPSATALTARQG